MKMCNYTHTYIFIYIVIHGEREREQNSNLGLLLSGHTAHGRLLNHWAKPVHRFVKAQTKQTYLSKNNVACLEKYGWFIWPYFDKHYIPFPWCSSLLKSMKHSLHPNMNSGISVFNNTFIHFSSYKQFLQRHTQYSINLSGQILG